MAVHINLSTANAVGPAYVFVTGQADKPREPKTDGLYVLTAHALHFYPDETLRAQKCVGTKVDKFGEREANDFDYYARHAAKYDLVGVRFDQPDLRRVRALVALTTARSRASKVLWNPMLGNRVLGWGRGDASARGVRTCRVSGHQVMDAAGAWRDKTDELVTSAIREFYQRMMAVALLTEDPVMIQGPLATCASVPGQKGQAAVKELTADFASRLAAKAAPAPTSVPSAQ